MSELKCSMLLMENVDDTPKIRMISVEEAEIPETMNGESGFHIFHVCKLTELILCQLLEKNSSIALSEEDVQAISVAASLHDIGKMRIPQSILNKSGKLSTVEYDIVKKHSVFGEQLIDEADCGELSGKLIQYAKDIAKNHHERIDGTGYPNGISGKEIPVWAQVVALADVYDALTSKRTYKQSFSQDVAIQMISSGMCGTFSEELVDCLLQVINHRSLVALRELFDKKRMIVTEQVSYVPKRVLFAGNTSYISKELAQTSFPESEVMIFQKENDLQAAFHTYEFDAVIYLSRNLTYECKEESDSEHLKEVLRCAADLKKEIRFVYLSSLDAVIEKQDGEAVLSGANEKLCEFYAEQSMLDMKIVRIPYLYSETNEKDFLYQVFQRLEGRKVIELHAQQQNPLYFLSCSDLSELLIRLFDNWNRGGGILTVGDEFHLTFSDFADALRKIKKAKVRFAGEKVTEPIRENNKVLRNQYGWFAKVSLIAELPELYEAYQNQSRSKEDGVLNRVKRFLKKYEVVVKIFELLLLFMVTEWFTQITDSAVIFSIIDFRMAYIVIMSLTYGLRYGLAAATLSSLSWVVAKMKTGMSLMTLFYEPTNWLAFVYFFLIGALCGYIKIKAADQLRFKEDENRLLEEKLTFTRDIYEDTYQEKRELKKQIISSKDSFGKIFDITQKLDTEEPYQLYLRIIETFEQILENRSISVYSVSQNSAFGRLEVASRDILDSVARSLSMEKYELMMEEISKGNIWKNTELLPDLPMYAAGICQDKNLTLCIFIWNAGADQQSLYYMNLFKILKDLVQMSLLRAYRYHEATREAQYLPNTSVMRAEAFAESLAHYQELAARKVSNYLLLELDTAGMELEQACHILSSAVRSNDILGVTEEKRLCVLLTQATKENLEFILPRFEALGMKATVVS